MYDQKKRTHGSGSVVEYRPGFWRIRYTKPDGSRGGQAGFTSRKAADQALKAITTDIDRGDYFDTAKGNITFRDFAVEYLEVASAGKAPGTIRNWNSLLRTTLYPTFGDKRLNQISERSVEVWWARHDAHKVNRRNAYFLLRPMMAKAVKWGFVLKSPCTIEDAAADVAKPRPSWETDDLRAVLAHDSTGLLEPLMWVQFAAHMRIGELAGLNRSDYDQATGRLTVERQDNLIGGRHLAQTKTGNSRTVKLLANGRDALDAYLTTHPMLPNAPMFVGPKGGRISQGTIRRAWNAALAASGLDDFHIHDLKSIGLTLLAEAGADMRDIMERGGHRSWAAAMRYQRSSAQRDAEIVDMADKRLTGTD
jgi:integrase